MKEPIRVSALRISVFVFAILAACSNDREYDLKNLSASRDFSGDVSVSKDNLGETTLNISIENIPRSLPNTEDNPYIAWAEDGNQTERLGVLNVDGADGVLIATTNLKRFRVFVTMESSADASTPTNVPLLQSPLITEK